MTKPIRMTNKARAAAKSLAVSYNAFNDARREGDDLGTVVFGRSLLESMAETGVEMFEPSLVNRIITLSEKRRAA